MNERATFLCDSSGQTLIVYIRGEIDHHTAVAVRNGIDAVLFERRPTQLILDLSAVGFMDSSGLGLIMGRLSVMKSLNGVMVLRNPGRETQTILTLAGMERLIPIEYGEASAETNSEIVKKNYVRPRVTLEKKGTRVGANADVSTTPMRRKRSKSPTTPA